MELLQKDLVKEGFRVSTADSGEGCLEFTGRIVPHLVLRNLRLPDMDGLEVRREPRTKRLPVVILGAK